MSPDCTLFLSHINGALFQQGADRGYWGILKEDEIENTWPYAYIWVAAAKKENQPDRFCFRFQLDGYTGTAPTACLWDCDTGTKLPTDKWPRGGKLVAATFKRSWPNALYAPCDRLAMPGHEDWKQKFPHVWWRSDHTIVNYLQFIHGLLNSSDYVKTQS